MALENFCPLTGNPILSVLRFQVTMHTIKNDLVILSDESKQERTNKRYKILRVAPCLSNRYLQDATMKDALSELSILLARALLGHIIFFPKGSQSQTFSLQLQTQPYTIQHQRDGA